MIYRTLGVASVGIALALAALSCGTDTSSSASMSQTSTAVLSTCAGQESPPATPPGYAPPSQGGEHNSLVDCQQGAVAPRVIPIGSATAVGAATAPSPTGGSAATPASSPAFSGPPQHGEE